MRMPCEGPIACWRVFPWSDSFILLLSVGYAMEGGFVVVSRERCSERLAHVHAAPPAARPSTLVVVVQSKLDGGGRGTHDPGARSGGSTMHLCTAPSLADAN